MPFFKKHKLRTAKINDFLIFARVIKLMKKQVHHSESGMRAIARMLEKMNRKKKSKFLESSETIRRTPMEKSEKI